MQVAADNRNNLSTSLESIVCTAIQAALNEELERSRAKLANVKQQLQDALRIAAGSLRDFNSMRAELAAERTRGKQALQAALEDLERVKQECLSAAVERDRNKGAASYVFSTRRRLRLLYEVVTGQPMRVSLSDAEAVDEFDAAVRHLKFDFTVMQDAREELARVKKERDGLAAQYRRLIDLSIQAKVYSPPAPIPFDLAANNRQVAARVLRHFAMTWGVGEHLRKYILEIADAYERGEREVPGA